MAKHIACFHRARGHRRDQRRLEARLADVATDTRTALAFLEDLEADLASLTQGLLRMASAVDRLKGTER
jgi:hypothetical protein